MELKKIIIVLSITIAIAIAIMFGASYAWYAYKNAETNISGGTIKETPTIIFSQTEYISLKQTLPIKDNDRYNYANKNSFTITIDKNLEDYEKGIEISLININMADELKIANYKYELLQNNIKVANGDFSNIGSNKSLIIMPMTKLSPATYPTTYSYELLIWLSDDESNQNTLMNKGFSAKISINSAIKK